MNLLSTSSVASWRRLVAVAALSLGLVAPGQAAVVISQVYGGGGNSGATYKNDFIELFNNGGSVENIGGWSVQYLSATGTGTWGFTAIPGGTTLQPGRYLLVQQAIGAGGTANLPTPDLTGTLAMSGTTGKVALVSNSTALSGGTPTGPTLVDLVGYGPTATAFEGNPTPLLSNTTAALRKGAGATDTNNNLADFTIGAPCPRNSASTTSACPGAGVIPTAAAVYTIQGSGAASPMAGATVITSGVVTKVTNNGFFIQDPVGDNNTATSDGIFVLADPALYVAVQVGNLLQVTAVVTEFSPGAGTAASPLTELTSVTNVTLLGTGQSITPVVVTLPLAAGDSFERFEGMLVRINEPMTVQQNFFQARFGQLTIGAGGRHETPTNRYRAGTTEAIALADLQARSRLLLDDGSSLQNPNPIPYYGGNGLPRAGDTVTGLTGVIDFGLATSTTAGAGLYRIQPTVAPVITVTNPRPASAPAVGGNLRVASMNVLNFFTTFTDGTTASGQTGQGCTLGGVSTASNCRGANSAAEFTRQRAKIVKALAGLNADVVGLMEIQNNGSTAAQNLVDALNVQVGAGTYAAVPDPANGTGTDAIKVAMIYKSATLSRVGSPASDTAAINNRPPLAQTFAASNGERFTLVVNHLKSKGSCPLSGAGDTDSGDGQGCWNATRVLQAQQLRNFVLSLQNSSGSTDVLLIGDFNAYGQEDPIIDLTLNGFVDQMSRFSPLAYSYVFDGTAGRLDHGISTATLSPRVVGAAHWHIDADESLAEDYNLEFKQPACATCAPDPFDGTLPFRASDHDPALLGLVLYKAITAVPGSTLVTGSAGDDVITVGAGRRTLTGGGGNDIFVFSAGYAGGATITDFQPGGDVISLRAVLQGLGIHVANPIGQGYVSCVMSGADAVIRIDPDAGGPAAPRAMLLLKNQNCSVLTASNFIF